MAREIRPLGPTDPPVLGSYRALGRIGEGGMGVVYLAADPAGRQVAVKAIHRSFAANREFAARFRREVEAARRVPRFCTAAVLDADVEGEVPFLVTEYVDGPTLHDAVLDGEPLAGERLTALAVGIAAALTAIHEAGVVHRDLKPGNVLLSSAGPRVIDFGVASAADTTAHTMTGQVIGTPAYMAPEQINGDRATAAADVFAWGGVVAYAASGEPPFGSTTSIPAVMHRILHEPPRLDALDVGLRDLVVAAMDKDPARRPTSRELFDRVRAYAAAETRARVAAADVLEHATEAALSSPWGPIQPPQSAVPTLLPDRPALAAPPTARPALAPAQAVTLPPGGYERPPAPRPPRGSSRAAVLAAAAVLAITLGVSLLLDPLGWRDDPAVAGGPETTTDPAGGPTSTGPSSDGPTTSAAAADFRLVDYTGRSVDRVVDELEAVDIEVVTEPGASTASDRGRVLEVRPGIGTTVAPGETVTLVVGDGSLGVTRQWAVFKRIGPDDFLNVADIVVQSSEGGERVVGKGKSPDISDDGRTIVYVDTTLVPRSSQAVVVGRDGSGRRELTDVTVGSVGDVAISPDGTRVAYTNNTGGIYVLGVDGSGKRLVADVDSFELDWSPDGTQIVFRRNSQELWVVGADGSGLRRLATPLPGDGIPSFPAWSPDGSLIAFADYRGGIYVVRPDGTGQAKVANGAYPGWTPSGSLAVSTSGGVILSDPDGADPQPVEGLYADGPVHYGSNS